MGLSLIIKELHDRLDVAVAEAYGWPADLTDDEILARLVALNKERAEEEKRGLVRWLRPDYQIPRFAKGVDKQAAKEEGAQVAAELIATVEQKPSFPTGAVEQTAAVFAALAAASQPLDAKGLAAQFKRTRTTEKKVGEVLASLARLGYVTSEDGKTFALRRVAKLQGAIDSKGGWDAVDTGRSMRAKTARRANQTSVELRLSSPFCKNILIYRIPKSNLYRFPSRPTRGALRDRHERGAGCGGRGRRVDERRLKRTAKSCGPDTPTLVSSFAEVIPRGDGGKKARSPGRARRKPLKPLRGECRVISGVTVVTMLVCFVSFCMRGCGRIGRPAFPAPSDFRGQGTFRQSSGDIARRDREAVSLRHCEERKRRSNPTFVLLRHGLLRGACHRARIRATRWLAMTGYGLFEN